MDNPATLTIITVNSTYEVRVDDSGNEVMYRNGARLGFNTPVTFRVLGFGFVATFNVEGIGPVRTSLVRAVNVNVVTL